MSYALDQSPYGVFDMAGNAWEYTKDWYDPSYYRDLRQLCPAQLRRAPRRAGRDRRRSS